MNSKYAVVSRDRSKWQCDFVSPEAFDKLLAETFDGRKLIVTRRTSEHLTHDLFTVSSFVHSWIWAGISHMMTDDAKPSLYPDLDTLMVYDLDDKSNVYITALSRKPSAPQESETVTDAS